MKFARWTFLVGGIYGLLVLLPQYFLEPPGLTHPELFYGFVGVALVWQVAFLVIGLDPLRFHPLMVVGVLEKASFAIAVVALFAAGRVAVPVLIFGLIDLTLGILFAVAWLRLRET
jgi:hypothetical protein